MYFLFFNLIFLVILTTIAARLFFYRRNIAKTLRFIGHTKTGYLKIRHDDGIIVDASEGIINILGLSLSKKEIVGRDIRDFFVKAQDQRTFLDELKENGGMIEKRIFHFITLTGKEKWVVYTSKTMRDVYSGALVVEIIAEDVTEEKTSLMEMTETETKYEQLFRSSGDMIILFDHKSGMIEDANPASVLITGYESAEMAGKPFETLIHPLKRNEFKDRERELLIKNISRLETIIVCKNGEYKDVWVTMNMFELKDKKKIMADVQDITELAQEREEQQKRRSELEKFCRASVTREERVKKLREELEQAKRQIENLRQEKTHG